MGSRTTRSRKGETEQQVENQSRAKWTVSLTKTLVDLMVEEIHKGNKSNKSFSKKGWKFICDNFRIQTGYWWDSEQLKSRYIALRKQYVCVAVLLDNPDFKWDDATCEISAVDEAAWERYIKNHPDAETVRSMGCPIYEQLRIIFGETKIKDNDEGISSSFPCPTVNDVVKLEEFSPSESDKYNNADLPNRKRGRKGIEDAIARGIMEIASSMKLRAEAISKFNSEFSISDCVGALDELQGVDEHVYNAALDLFVDRSARETFLTLRVDKRFIWLQRKCLLADTLIM
ncbi:PREDICTED: uncharacterized protein LOC105965085 [Erythranthe guttata]|uniref:uncharacterized protein LOC105965085 n=1 Tax=Erythranthe guttata TaxID=4155 RepID=UPI00064DF7C8|nr:PREDICTED: uncharacterized protein LOC105965085 [Erythranthe guttata]|eukprot:XP_012845053.1 PREDICTED: uncharacterized protein LOC105965085 [Erythranthe guttata]